MARGKHFKQTQDVQPVYDPWQSYDPNGSYDADARDTDAPDTHDDKPAADAPSPWLVLSTVIKYGTALLLAGLCAYEEGSPRLMLAFAVELLFIMTLSNSVWRLNRVVGTILNDLLVLLFLLQVMVLYFGGTYLSSIMVTNLEFIGDIQGNARAYVVAAVIISLIALLPAGPLWKASAKQSGAALGISAALLAISLVTGSSYSPGFAYINLARQMYVIYERNMRLKSAKGDPSQFYSDHVTQGIDRPEVLPEKPNVVLIMVEGLSKNISEDDRQIMPHMADYEQRSLSFVNYFDHTAATLRGIIGQLYSGYQNDGFEKNELVSLQSALGEAGYRTAFINTEPKNELFAGYLNNLGFDQVVDGRDPVGEDGEGPDGSLTDRQAYEALFAQMEAMGAQEEPFFLSIYTFGTHATFDSPDMFYGNGATAELNKFYNTDMWFGTFMERFEQSGLFDNTIIVFTTDHATYADKEYKRAFPDYVRRRPFLDRVPFFIYHKDVDAHLVDAKGKNSLDLAPTILDYLDISPANYFLGQSLFVEADESPYDTLFSDTSDQSSSTNGDIVVLEGEELEWFEGQLFEYFAALTHGASGK
ncbi:MAG: LTA synthase family protein [Atopobiaceae bacterium]|nr:LTA synthase family protein [Atopobiaceae bacterium]